MSINTCCFFGHRTISETEKLKKYISCIIEELIVKEGVKIFLFGSRSQFNDLCYEIVTQLKEKFPYIKRIYVRAEYPYINNNYEAYLFKKYEYTYFPQKILNSNKTIYIKRNYEIIDKSDFCVIYYYESNIIPERNSGTKIAYNYAIKKYKKIINVYNS